MADTMISLPLELHYGNGAVTNWGRVVQSLGSKASALLFEGPRVLRCESGWLHTLGVIRRDCFRHDDYRRTSIQDAAAQHYRESGSDIVISIGGGSVMDAAKVRRAAPDKRWVIARLSDGRPRGARCGWGLRSGIR